MPHTFATQLTTDLRIYLQSHQLLDIDLPICDDLEDKWVSIGTDYLTDGVREFNESPTATFGWMMFLGMAMAKLWDADWEHISPMQHPYFQLRDVRGFDHMDEYILEGILGGTPDEHARINHIVGECAARTLHAYLRQNFTPETKEAFSAFIDCLHTLYYMGYAMQLNQMGYHMTECQI